VSENADRKGIGRSPARIALVGLAIFSALAISGAIGFLVAFAFASSDSEARQAKAASFRLARKQAQASAFRRAAVRGRQAGIKVGRQSAKWEAGTQGRQNGEAEAEAQLAAIAAAEAEAQERAENCGAPLFVEGYCPTDAEIEQEDQAESEGGLP
jgi:hypothetical protein